MASETSDLTFVRCPSCRSLVPASATRCRICNNPLDGLNKEEPGTAPKGGGRVRQKTITATPEEVAAVLNSAQDVPPAAPAAQQRPAVSPVSASPKAEAIVDDLDPLGSYLQELETGGDDGAPEARGATTSAAATSPATDDDDDLFDFDLFDDPAPEPVAQPKAEPAPDPLPFREEPPVREVPPAAVEARPEPVRKPEPPPRAPEPPRSAPREHQQARQGQGNGEPRRNDQRPQQQDAKGNNRSDRMQEQRSAKPAQPAPHKHHDNQKHHEQQKARREERDPRKQDRPPRQEPMRREPEHRDERPSHTAVAGPKTGKMRPGRLFGWLVSYENPDGRAIELREGKFFVTSSSIKGSDLVLEDPSISTPHALMSISDSGLLVQDLMSDYGVFVRTDNDVDYRREDGVIRIEHGDWVRFGEVEFLVIIVPSTVR